MNIEKINTLKDQYLLIKESRAVLLRYCATLSKDHFYATDPSFGHGSIHILLAHISNTYRFWIGEQLLGKTNTYIVYSNTTSLESLCSSFEEIDLLMVAFFQYLPTISSEQLIRYEIDGKEGMTTALKAFTHVITHEYHHKGQLLALSRLLGYIPVDTDILR